MKFLTFIFAIVFSFELHAQFAPKSNPHRGLYVDKFVKTLVDNSSIFDPEFSILAVDKNRDGIFEREDSLLSYAAANHITYLALFDLHRIFGRHFMVWDENLHRSVDLETHLDRFLRKAKSQYGIDQLGAIGGSVSFFDSLATYLNRYPLSDIDVVNIEYEFWQSCGPEFPNYVTILDAMYNFKLTYNLTHPTNPIFAESYLADLYACNSSYGALSVVRTVDGCTSCSPCSSCTNPQPRKADRMLHAWFVVDPGSVNIAEQNVFENSLTGDSTDFHPILYAESYNTGGTVDWTGVWFPLSPYNNIFTAEESYYTHWRNDPNVAFGTPRQNDVQPGGVQWFAASNMVGHLDNPRILQNTGPYCTQNLLQQITFNYYGPIENDLAYQFWITRNSDNATVYPLAGGRVNGASGVYQPLTGTTSLIKSIDFSDTNVFPTCFLPEGDYSAHLVLNYSNGQSYQCNNSLIVNHTPRIQIMGDSTFCQGGFTYLHANEPANSFAWYKDGQPAGTSPYLKAEDDANYSVTVTGGTCAGSSNTIHIHVLANPAVNLNAVCNGNGTATIKTNLIPAALTSTTITGPGGMQYRWNTDDSTDQIIVTPPTSNTTYRVNVTNPYNGCTRTAQIIMKSPLPAPISSAITINNQPSTSCSSDGSITVNLFNSGAPTYFLWSNGATTQSISGLSPGTYTVAMTTWAAGCTTYDSVTIGTPPTNGPLVPSVIQDAVCDNSATGIIHLNIAGGNPPFNFHWLDFPEDSVHNPFSLDQDSLFPGTYKLKITDASGCVFQYTYVVGMNHLKQIVHVTTSPVTGCASSANGAAAVSATGGVLPYNYSWDDALHQTGVTANSLPAGTTRVVVTDGLGCSVTAFAMLASNQLPIQIHSLDSSKVIVTCSENDGALYLNIHGGTKPYTVSSPWIADSNFAMMNNLVAGIYPVQVTDLNGCTLNDTFSISNPQPIDVFSTSHQATCTGCQDGSFEVSFTGGTAPFQITSQPSGVVIGNTIQNLSGGFYSICVTDKFGCSNCIQDTITENLPGVFSLEANSFIIASPNPSSESTTIELQYRKSFSGTYSVINASGMPVEYSKVNSPKFTINTGRFAQGVYFLKVFNEELKLIAVKKLVVIR